MSLDVSELRVGNYMTAFPLSVLPEVGLYDAACFMARRGIGNLIVSDNDGTPLGILSERNILREISLKNTLSNIRIDEIEYSQFEKISHESSVLDASKKIFPKKSKLLVFDSSDSLVGIITPSDLLRAFRRTYLSPPLDDVQKSEVVYIDTQATIKDACTILFKKGIGSVVIKNDKLGIFTERDLLFKVLLNKVSFDEKIKMYSTFPLIFAKDGILANDAASIMSANGIKHLVLKENDVVSGIVSAIDIVEAYQNNSAQLHNY